MASWEDAAEHAAADVANAVKDAVGGGSSADAPFTFTIDDYGTEIDVSGFDGEEKLSALYCFDVRIRVSDGPDAFEPAAFGKGATLSIVSHDSSPRVLRGIVAAISYEGRNASDQTSFYSVRFVPHLWLLGKRKNSRIFQDRRVDEIISLILETWRIPARFLLAKPLPIRTYCVQYRETDLEFVRRIAAEEGLFFFFEPPSGDATLDDGSTSPDETVVFGDSTSAYPALRDDSIPAPDAPPPSSPGSSPSIDFIDRSAQETEEAVFVFATRKSIRSTSILREAYDWTHPTLDVSLNAPKDAASSNTLVAPSPAPLEVYEHMSEYEDLPDADAVQAELDAHRRRAVVALGESTVRAFASGRRFTLASHVEESLDREWTIVGVRHHGEIPERTHGHDQHDKDADKKKDTYSNVFECVPSDVPYRPKRPRRLLTQVLESATVCGDGADVYTDESGRIQVRFPWDRVGATNPHASCFMRVAQAWAGASWGFQFVPRIGMEVLVSFIGGDEDRPVVMGCLYNGTHPPPYLLPQQAARSGIRSHSFGNSGGYNELGFVDSPGAESLILRAERDHERIVLNDERVSVGGDMRLQIRGALDEACNHRSSLVEGNEALSIGTNRRLVVNGEEAIRIGGDRHEVIGGRLRQFLQDWTSSVSGDRRLDVAGNLQITAGTEGQTNDISITAEGNSRLYATNRTTLIADEELVIQCGTTTLTLKKDELKIEAATITVNASKAVTVTGKGPSIKLDDQAQVTADQIQLLSKGGSIDLNSDKAKVFGPQVEVNAGTDPPQKSDSSPDAPTQDFKFQMLDETLTPYASKTYSLLTEGFKVKATTDKDGYVTQKLPKDAITARITLWTDDYPTGPTIVSTVRLGPIAIGPDQPRGAAIRLRNLGYYAGVDVDEITPELTDAILWFQSDLEIAMTGLLDADTIAKIKASHPEG